MAMVSNELLDSMSGRWTSRRPKAILGQHRRDVGDESARILEVVEHGMLVRRAPCDRRTAPLAPPRRIVADELDLRRRLDRADVRRLEPDQRPILGRDRPAAACRRWRDVHDRSSDCRFSLSSRPRRDAARCCVMVWLIPDR